MWNIESKSEYCSLWELKAGYDVDGKNIMFNDGFLWWCIFEYFFTNELLLKRHFGYIVFKNRMKNERLINFKYSWLPVPFF